MSEQVDDKPKEWVLEYSEGGLEVQRERLICTREKAVTYANNYCGSMWTLTEKGTQSVVTPSMMAAMEAVAT